MSPAAKDRLRLIGVVVSLVAELALILLGAFSMWQGQFVEGMAKIRALLRRGLITGCACGCRGDLKIPESAGR